MTAEDSLKAYQAEHERMLRRQPIPCTPYMPMLGWKSLVAIPTIAVIIVGVLTWYLVQDMNRWYDDFDVEMARYRAYMRECVPTQPARRCDELWEWGKR